MNEKTIKICEEAHIALSYAKGKGIKIGEYATDAILKAIKKDYPDIIELMKSNSTEFKLRQNKSK